MASAVVVIAADVAASAVSAATVVARVALAAQGAIRVALAALAGKLMTRVKRAAAGNTVAACLER